MRSIVISGLALSLTGCVALSDIPPAGPFIIDSSINPPPAAGPLPPPAAAALNVLKMQYSAYKTNRARAEEGRQFNNYFTMFSAVGLLVSTVGDLHPDTVKGWTAGSGLGLLASKSSNVTTLKNAYDTAMSRLNCVSIEAVPFALPSAAADQEELKGQVLAVQADVDDGLANVSAAGKTDLAEAITKAKVAIGKANDHISAIYSAPSTILGAAGIIDDQVQAAQRGATVDLGKLVADIIALKAPPSTGAAPAAPAASGGAARAVLPPPPGRAKGDADYIQQLNTSTSGLDALTKRVDYSDHRTKMTACPTRA